MRTVILWIGAAAAVAMTGAARAVIVVQGTELPSYIAVTNQLAMSHGATFTSNNGAVTFGEMDPGVVGIFGTDPTGPSMWGYMAFFSPIEVSFVNMGDGITPTIVNGTISAVFGDGGGDTDGIRLRAYDLANNLIGSSTALSATYGNISFTGVGIHRVVFDQSGLGSPTSDTFLESLTYPDPIPAPGAALLLAAGTLAVRARRRA